MSEREMNTEIRNIIEKLDRGERADTKIAKLINSLDFVKMFDLFQYATTNAALARVGLGISPSSISASVNAWAILRDALGARLRAVLTSTALNGVELAFRMEDHHLCS